MYIYLKMQIRLEQPKPSLLPFHIGDLWFLEAEWCAQRARRSKTIGSYIIYCNRNKTEQTEVTNTTTCLGKIYRKKQIVTHQTASHLRVWTQLISFLPSLDTSAGCHTTLVSPLTLKFRVLSLSVQQAANGTVGIFLVRYTANKILTSYSTWRHKC